MKYFLDTEFIEDGKTIDLISIGIVAEDGREYYACNDECDLSKASPWVQDNVLVHLPPKHIGINPGNPDVSPSVRQDILLWKTREQIAKDIMLLTLPCSGSPVFPSKPEFWGYYADYDWVVFCQLWGTMMDLPKDFPMYCRDIKQLCDSLGNPKLPEQGKGEHHALLDARHNQTMYEFLVNMERGSHANSK